MKRVLAFLKRRRARQAGKLHEARRATKHSSPYADLDRNRVQGDARGGFDAGGGGGGF